MTDPAGHPLPRLRIDASTDTHPYEQVRSQLAVAVASGELPAGTRLPTVRTLATELQVAVNTVARAYRELEADGVVVTEGRRGTFVRGEPPTADAATAAQTYAGAARRAGLTLAEATRLLERSW
jgi:DNA-binding transcriptional regulator YhcF (GntR family)